MGLYLADSSLTHLLFQSLTHLPNYSLSHFLTYSLTYLLTHSLSHIGDILHENLLEWTSWTHEKVEVGFYVILPEVIAGLNYRLVVEKITVICKKEME